MKRLFFLVGLVCSLSVTAQRFSQEVFHEGFLVTTNRDTLTGQLKYDLDANILTVFDRGKTKSFSSQKVFYFEIFDQILDNYRQFYTNPNNVNVDYKIPIFFELVYEDKISLMARERIVSQAVNNASPYWGGGTGQQLVIKYSYYFMSDKGKITYYNGKKKDLLNFMSKKQTEIKKYIKNNRLDTDKMSDLVRITAFYNSI